MSRNKKNKGVSRQKTKEDQEFYDQLERSVPGAGTTAPQEAEEGGSVSARLAAGEYSQYQGDRHRIPTPDEVRAGKRSSSIVWLSVAVTLLSSMIGLAFWAGKLQMRAEMHDSSLRRIEASVGDIDSRVGDLRVAMAKLEADKSAGKDIQAEYQSVKEELSALLQVVKTIERTSEKHTTDIQGLIGRLAVLEKASPKVQNDPNL